jgi:hypothetical protein
MAAKGASARDPLFDEVEVETAIDGLQLVPDRLPAILPTKQEIRTFRADLIERLTGNLGPLKAYLLVKLIEKIVADKEEGVIKHLLDGATTEFMSLYPNQKTAEVLGVSVTTKGRSYWTYPVNVNEFEVVVEEMKAKLAGMKKASEIDKSATRMQVPNVSLSVSF